MDDFFESTSESRNTGGAIYGIIYAVVWGYFLFSANKSLQTNTCYAAIDIDGATYALNEAPLDIESSNVGKSM